MCDNLPLGEEMASKGFAGGSVAKLRRGCQAVRSAAGDGERPFDLALCVGTSTYWAAVVVMFLFPADLGAASGAPTKLAGYLVLALFTALGFAFPGVFSSERGRRRVAVADLALLALLCAPVPSLGSLAHGAVALVARMFVISTLMVLWGFAFASLDRRDASRSVALSALASNVLVLAAVALEGSPAPLPVHACLLYLAVSCVVILARRVQFSNWHRRRVSPEDGGDARSFYASRIVLGFVLGLCVALPRSLAAGDASLRLLLVGAAAALLALAVFVRGAGEPYAAHPALSIVAIVNVYLPFFDRGVESAAEASAALTWMAWAMLSSVQLSDMKERFGLSELRLCLMDKTVLSLAIAAGMGASLAAGAVFGSIADEAIGACETLILAALCLVVLFVALTMACLVEARRQDQMRDEVAVARRERLQALYDSLAREFDLTARERQVMGMLAEGYTRAYIRERLDVSDGTAKAHIAHIYAKMGVHHKDDLLALIDQRMAGS